MKGLAVPLPSWRDWKEGERERKREREGGGGAAEDQSGTNVLECTT